MDKNENAGLLQPCIHFMEMVKGSGSMSLT